MHFTIDAPEALYEKKQTIMKYENENLKFKAQIEILKATSAEKDIVITKWKTIVKESEGENIGLYEIHAWNNFLKHYCSASSKVCM